MKLLEILFLSEYKSRIWFCDEFSGLIPKIWRTNTDQSVLPNSLKKLLSVLKV